MSDSQKIPFLDLVAPHRELQSELVSVFQKVLSTAGFIGGPMLESFERDFAQFCDTKHCVGVASGTDAVRFALMAVGVQPGDIVLTVPSTFIATTEAITQAGASADFVDVDERTYNLDVEKLHEYLETKCIVESGRTIHRASRRPVTAIVPVHLYGQMVDMDPIMELAAKHGMTVVEDACQAHGAEYFSKKENRWRKAGSMGKAGAFSFYPGKNLGACGEAGAVTANDEALAAKVRMIRDHGQSRKYYHDVEGYNGRLDALQAGLLHVKLAHLAEWNTKRREIAARYNRLLGEATNVVVPYEPSWSRGVYHLYVVRTPERNQLQEHLSKAGIGTGIHYPVPVHLQKPYLAIGFKSGDFPAAEKAAEQILSLPMFPSLTPAQQDRVIEEIARFEKSGENAVPAQPAVRA